MAVLAVPGMAFAQATATSGSAVGPYSVLVAGFAMAFAAGLCALGHRSSSAVGA